jgi:uncharacterized membrane protein
VDADVPAPAQAPAGRGQVAESRVGDGTVRYRYPAYVGAGVAASVAAAFLGYAQKLPCSSGGAWNSFTGQFRHACYTDIYPLYYNEGLSTGQVPYSGHPVEYPVLLGAMMQLAAWMVHSVTDAFARGKDFYFVTIALLAVCLLAGVLATGYAAGREGSQQLKATLMVALSPGLILAAYINWDLLAMALTAGGIAAWAARREFLAGALLGLAVATKFYPLLFFAPLLLVCLRAGQMRAFWRAAAGGVIAWLVVNLPIALTATAGWGRFYAFSRSRGADWGSVWYMFEHFNVPVLGNPSIGRLNLASSAAFAIAFVAIAVLALAAPRRPRLPQLCFLVLATFLMLNKVWSPQYVIWLVPFAVLARPRLWPYLLWQLTEVVYFFGVWGYFVYLYRTPTEGGFQGVTPGWYFAILVARFLAVGLYAGLVVNDVLHPERDVVRLSGQDDPAGGVLDGAPDRLVLGWLPGARRAAQASVSLSRSQPMSAASPASGVSHTTGAPAARTTSSSTAGSMVPESKLACLSAPEANSSRELLQCTRSIRPVIALIRSTASERSMPAEFAWQVSRQNPISPPSGAASATASHSRAMASSDLAIAPVPPAVFSMNIGSGRSIRSTALRQFSSPSAASTPALTCPPCTISARAPIDAAACSCWSSSFLDGILMRLLVVATLIT